MGRERRDESRRCRHECLRHVAAPVLQTKGVPYNGYMRMLAVVLTLLAPAGLRAEVHHLTLRQALELALKQNPEIMLARLDEQKAMEGVRVARDPFTPRITVGSGLAYSNGFPMTIEGSAPSVVQAYAKQYIFNRQQSYVVAQAKEEARGAGIATAERRDEIAYRTTALFLDAERGARVSEMARKQADSLDKVAQSVKSQVDEGRVLAIEGKRAALNLARARQTVTNLEADQAFAETSLATVLGFTAEDRARPIVEDRKPPEMPMSEEDSIEGALRFSKELRRLESRILAKGLEIRGDRAARLPRIDLVAQYGLFAKFNHYEDYFRKFQRNNGELGVSFQLPVLPGPGISALTAQRNAEVAQLRLQMANARNQIILTAQQAYGDIARAEAAREVARLDLEVAREQVNINLALMQEGRMSLSQVEEARAVEDTKWMAFYDAGYALEKARWNLARQTGDLLSALR
jgi:outer membrane protein